MDSQVAKTVVYNARSILREYIQEWSLKCLVLGVSGGIDSALVAALAKPICDELKIPLHGRSIPIEGNKQDEINRAILVGKTFCTTFKETHVSKIYKSFLDRYEIQEHGNISKIAKGNVKARIRMMYLFALAGEEGGMVLSTDNLTEYHLGFWTLHGDVGNYGMIQNLWKTEVYSIAEYISNKEDGITPEQQQALDECILAVPTDGLGITDCDLDQIMPGWAVDNTVPMNGYEKVDNILKGYLSIRENRYIEPGLKKASGIENCPVVQRHLSSEYKRNDPINIPREELFIANRQ